MFYVFILILNFLHRFVYYVLSGNLYDFFDNVVYKYRSLNDFFYGFLNYPFDSIFNYLLYGDLNDFLNVISVFFLNLLNYFLLHYIDFSRKNLIVVLEIFDVFFIYLNNLVNENCFLNDLVYVFLCNSFHGNLQYFLYINWSLNYFLNRSLHIFVCRNFHYFLHGFFSVNLCDYISVYVFFYRLFNNDIYRNIHFFVNRNGFIHKNVYIFLNDSFVNDYLFLVDVDIDVPIVLVH